MRLRFVLTYHFHEVGKTAIRERDAGLVEFCRRRALGASVAGLRTGAAYRGTIKGDLSFPADFLLNSLSSGLL